MNDELVNIVRRFDGIETRMHEMKQRLMAIEMAALDQQGMQEKFNGQKMRIDRMLGTIDDLLKRFEAWKAVGNDMGQDVIQLQAAVLKTGEGLDRLNERLDRHGRLIEHMAEVAKAMTLFMTEVRAILGAKADGTATH